MISQIIDALAKFQQCLSENGVARHVVALPAPPVLALPAPSESMEASDVFTFTITEVEIENVSRDLFASGHYSLAVQEAFKAVEKFVQSKSGSGLSGTPLMDNLFGPKSPVLVWSDRTTTSQKDEQSGYHRLYSGAMLGIRNPATHEFNWIDDSEIALELLVFAQHLIRKAKACTLLSTLT